MFTKKIILFIIIFTTTVTLSSAQRYAIRNTSVITMNNEQILQDHTILIENGIIREVGPSDRTKAPKGYSIIDGRGKYIMPGLFDMHAHFFQEQGEHRDTKETELKLMLINGLTTVRIMAGHPDYLDARSNVADGKWLGPDLSIASPQLVGRWPWPPDFKNYEIVSTPEEGAAAVKKFKADGYNAIKLTFMIKPDVYDAVIKAGTQENIKIVGHVGPRVKLPAALEAKQQIEHMDEFIDMLLPDTSYNHGQSVSDMNIWKPNAWATVPHLDESKIPQLVKMVKDAGVYVTPTNYFFLSSFGEGMTEEEYKQKPDYNYIPELLKKERWHIRDVYSKRQIPESSRMRYTQLRKKMTYELARAGVPLMAGSDSPEWFLVTGFSIHDELETFVKSGLTPYEALRTATVVPAQFLDMITTKGTIEKGKQADLVMLDQNPLENIRNTRSINIVIKKGVVVDNKSIQKLTEEVRSLGN